MLSLRKPNLKRSVCFRLLIVLTGPRPRPRPRILPLILTWILLRTVRGIRSGHIVLIDSTFF